MTNAEGREAGAERSRMNIVIVGHVDHGKSTVIGRLLVDTGSLPEGRLEAVRASCRRNAKPFEYAFLLDALKDEQAQGITIDAARCFFHTALRDYIIIDAPGHIEFLKNMITGASRAEAALLVIDANEGIRENSKRHGHMVAMLGVRQVTVLVNKMDLVDYRQSRFEELRETYSAYLRQIAVEPVSFIPVSAREGDNIAAASALMPWYSGPTVLGQLDLFASGGSPVDKPFRLPVQDVYKFTQSGDERRIVAGTVEAGSVSAGDEVLFLPSGKRSSVASIESFNTPPKSVVSVGQATGFTLSTQIYVRPGELMVPAAGPLPEVGHRFRANIFWVGRTPMSPEKEYKLKLGTARVSVRLSRILGTLDASELHLSHTKRQLDSRDVGECILETTRPIAFDLAARNESTGRFVIVDNYEIAGGGIVLENLSDGETLLERHIRERERHWETGNVLAADRERANRHRAKFIVITGAPHTGKRVLARELESTLFRNGCSTYYLGTAAIEHGLEADLRANADSGEERLRRIGELARIMTDAGQIFITAVDDADDFDIAVLRQLNEPSEILVVNIGRNDFSTTVPDLQIGAVRDLFDAIDRIAHLLQSRDIISDYQI